MSLNILAVRKQLRQDFRTRLFAFFRRQFMLRYRLKPIAPNKLSHHHLFLLESLTRELQCAAVLGHRSHYLIRCTGRNLSLDL